MNEKRITDAIQLGFTIWEQSNTGLDFEMIDGPIADINVHWDMLPEPTHVGLAEYTQPYNGIITIHVGDYNCEGTYVEYSSDSLTSTTMHEIGHILGLEHHIDPEHLMYGIEFTQNPFDTMGYTIPEGLPDDGYFVGQKNLDDRLNVLKKELDRLDLQINNRLADFGMTREQYTSGSVPPDVFNSINPLINKYDYLIDEHNLIVDKINCFNFDRINTPQKVLDVETKVTSIETMLTSIQQSISDLTSMINDIISGNTPDPTPASLSGTVFRDSNNDGIMDAGEFGLADKQVTVIPLASTNTSISKTADQNGMYSFDTLTPGEYIVFVPADGYIYSITITANQPLVHNIAIP